MWYRLLKNKFTIIKLKNIKIDFYYFQRLTLSNDDDPTFLCRIVITRCDYEELKKQQGLLIDFDNFPSQVVRLLQQCTANNM